VEWDSCKGVTQTEDNECQKIEIIKGPFPDGTLIEMANSKHPIFKSTNFCNFNAASLID
jgi:hypothetical protein